TLMILGFDNSGASPGFGSVLILSGAALTPISIPTPGVVAVNSRNLVSTPFSLTKTTITRSDVGGNWITDGFARGEAVAIGGQSGYWLVSDDPTATTLPLQGGDLTTLPAVQKVAIVRIGGDTINVNGSSEVVTGNCDVAAPVPGTPPVGDPAGTADRLTRNDGNAWDGDGAHAGDSAFAVGQQVTISATFSFPQVTFARNAMGDTITRGSGSWKSDGFAIGQTIVITGTTSTNSDPSNSGDFLTNNGSFTIANVPDATITLTAANTVVPTAFGATEPAKISLYGNFIVTGFADDLGNGRHKTLLVNGAVLPRQTAVPMTVNVDAPLVVYGDTSQDGVWYNGVATQQSLGKFASKPQPHMDNVQFTLSTPSIGQISPTLTPVGGIAISAPYAGFNTVSDTDDTFGNLTRADGGSWVAAGFKVNGLVTINGVAVGTVYGFKSDKPADPNAADILVLNNLLPGFAA